MDKATEGHMKELCRVIKYALDTQNIGLKLKPEENDNKLWELKAYSDADFFFFLLEKEILDVR